jgi:hypothetical protein
MLYLISIIFASYLFKYFKFLNFFIESIILVNIILSSFETSFVPPKKLNFLILKVVFESSLLIVNGSIDIESFSKSL